MAEDEAFRRVVAQAPAPVSAASDWTSRVLVAGLKPAQHLLVPLHRRGRERQPRRPDDHRARRPTTAAPVNFAFVSCQSVNEGTLNAYRRMIFEDERAAPADQLGFVLHLGDFIYEVVWYPEDREDPLRPHDLRGRAHPRRREGRQLPHPADRRRLSRRLPRLSARSRPPGRARALAVRRHVGQPRVLAGRAGRASSRPARTRGRARRVKVAANQAWFEYQPARVAKPSGPSLETFDPPAVKDVAIERFDDNGLGDEPNNLTAIDSLKAYRALRYGRHLDLIITDQHSYRSPDPFGLPELGKLGGDEFPACSPRR